MDVANVRALWEDWKKNDNDRPILEHRVRKRGEVPTVNNGSSEEESPRKQQAISVKREDITDDSSDNEQHPQTQPLYSVKCETHTYSVTEDGLSGTMLAAASIKSETRDGSGHADCPIKNESGIVPNETRTRTQGNGSNSHNHSEMFHHVPIKMEES
eukprot:CAMPEP_0194140396 /NCGR_PEP_ID=MMETSP0152-20130528/9950_1 /TAXON_ID=1049557 /ORGANISM="Thalassiothrix antarctica, Strain L6-D1" /LENGTH=156 /DNA_ID=CAMNT_0038838625 /DNA_START=9 /DNA_END=479 /DNA_ORIENTATION=-